MGPVQLRDICLVSSKANLTICYTLNESGMSVSSKFLSRFFFFFIVIALKVESLSLYKFSFIVIAFG